MKKIILLILSVPLILSAIACSNNGQTQTQYNATELKIIRTYDEAIEEARQEASDTKTQMPKLMAELEKTQSDSEARRIAKKYDRIADIISDDMSKESIYDLAKSFYETADSTFEETKEMFEAAKQENLEKYGRNKNQN